MRDMFISPCLHCIRPVSYTHLDVYKRQVFFSLFRKVIIVIPLTLMLPMISGLGIHGVFLAEPISNVIGGTASFVTMLITVWPELKKSTKKTSV